METYKMKRYTQVLLLRKKEHKVGWLKNETVKTGKFEDWKIVEVYSSYPSEFVQKNYAKGILN